MIMKLLDAKDTPNWTLSSQLSPVVLAQGVADVAIACPLPQGDGTKHAS